MKYTIRFPFLRNSRAICDIKDETGEIVGYIQRYHANWKQRAINLIFDNFVNNIKVYDSDKQLVLHIVEVNNFKTLIVERWRILIGDQEHKMESKTKIKTNPQFLYTKNDEQVWIKKDFADRIVRFSIHNKKIAEAIPAGLMPPQSNLVTFDIFDSTLDISEVAALYFILALKN